MNNIFSLPTPDDFNYSECLRFLQRSPLECLFFVKNERISFAFLVENEMFLVEIFWKKEKLHLEIISGELTKKSKKVISQHVLEWLDVSRNLNGFNAIAVQDDLLKPLCEKFSGLRLVGVPHFLEAISWAIIGQQINLTFAYTLKKRLVENYGQKITHGEDTFYLFPTAETIANLTEEDLRPHQFSRSKIKYLTGVAQAIHEGEFSKTNLSKLPYEEAKAKLIELKGVGNWTADYVLMKCLRRQDAFPITDVGIHNAIKKQMGLAEKPSLERVEKMSENWVGWKGYAAFYLWQSLLA